MPRNVSTPHFVEEDATEASPHFRLGSSPSVGRGPSSGVMIIPEDGSVEEYPENNPEGTDVDAAATSSAPHSRHRPRSHAANNSAQFAPLSWEPYFDESKDVAIPGTQNVFHVYTAGTEGPVVLCLHGGGYTGLSYALSAKLMKERVRVIAMDLRGHGLTRTDNDTDLSAETLCADVVALVNALYGEDEQPPAIVLIGHSMGGAIAVRTAEQGLLPSLAGLVVVDVVEGTAMASLAHMQALLAARPVKFASIEKAVEWSVMLGNLRNPESARVSVPSMLRPLEEASGSSSSSNTKYTWRTNLEASETFWRGWYENLSEIFLRSHVPKLLMLAGTDRLDKVLTIAQMQGKFQMVLVRHAGHAIQEDDPDEFATSVLGFIGRNRIGTFGVEILGLKHK